jgi:hypothetical protein
MRALFPIALSVFMCSLLQVSTAAAQSCYAADEHGQRCVPPGRWSKTDNQTFGRHEEAHFTNRCDRPITVRLQMNMKSGGVTTAYVFLSPNQSDGAQSCDEAAGCVGMSELGTECPDASNSQSEAQESKPKQPSSDLQRRLKRADEKAQGANETNERHEQELRDKAASQPSTDLQKRLRRADEKALGADQANERNEQALREKVKDEEAERAANEARGRQAKLDREQAQRDAESARGWHCTNDSFSSCNHLCQISVFQRFPQVEFTDIRYCEDVCRENAKGQFCWREVYNCDEFPAYLAKRGLFCNK